MLSADSLRTLLAAFESERVKDHLCRMNLIAGGESGHEEQCRALASCEMGLAAPDFFDNYRIAVAVGRACDFSPSHWDIADKMYMHELIRRQHVKEWRREAAQHKASLENYLERAGLPGIYEEALYELIEAGKKSEAIRLACRAEDFTAAAYLARRYGSPLEPIKTLAETLLARKESGYEHGHFQTSHAQTVWVPFSSVVGDGRMFRFYDRTGVILGPEGSWLLEASSKADRSRTKLYGKILALQQKYNQRVTELLSHDAPELREETENYSALRELQHAA